MSVCRSSTCLLRPNVASASSSSLSATKARPFSATCVQQKRRGPPTKSWQRRVRPVYEQMPWRDQKKLDDVVKTMPSYSKEEMDAMKHYYSPEQMEALKEAEKAIDPRDLVTQGAMRRDAWVPKYIDDFAYIDPFLDHKEIKYPTYAKPLREITGEEFQKRLIQRLKDPRTTDELFDESEKLALKPEIKEFLWKLRRWKGTDKDAYVRDILHRYVPIPPKDPNTIIDDLGIDPSDPFMLADGPSRDILMDPAYDETMQEIPKMDDPSIRWPSHDETPDSIAMRRVSQETGFSLDQIKGFRVKNLVFRRVVNQTRMGKIPSMYSLTVAGNGNGMIGLGEGKSAEVAESSRQAMMNALRNMRPIPRYEDRTIFGEITKKVGGTTVQITAKPPGFGVRCQHLIFEICRCAGIHDLSARVGRARNPMNTVKAMFEALWGQKLPDDIARARGRKLVDLRRVYYDGNVY